MRYTEITETCDVCGKRFHGPQVNVHGSYDYINHTNFSNNIHVMFNRVEGMPVGKASDEFVSEFFQSVHGGTIPKDDAIDFLECLRHYKTPNKELFDKIITKIEARISRRK